MLNYLQKFNELPQELKDAVSSREVLGAINEIEQKYNINLATVIMRVMVKDISIVDLPKFFVFENQMDGRMAEKVTEELRTRVFSGVSQYLDFVPSEFIKKEEEEEKEKKPGFFSRIFHPKDDQTDVSGSNFFFSAEDEEEVRKLAKRVENFQKEREVEEKQKPKETTPKITTEEKIEMIMKELNINFSSEDLMKRLKQVIKTYLVGIRSKVDSKQTLIKSVDFGGLGLEVNQADVVINTADQYKYKDDIKSIKKPEPAVKVPEDKPEEKVPVPQEDTFEMPQEGKSQEEESGVKEEVVDPGKLKASGIRDVEYDFSSLKKKQASESIETEEKEASQAKEQDKEKQPQEMNFAPEIEEKFEENKEEPPTGAEMEPIIEMEEKQDEKKEKKEDKTKEDEGGVIDLSKTEKKEKDTEKAESHGKIDLDKILGESGEEKSSPAIEKEERTEEPKEEESQNINMITRPAPKDTDGKIKMEDVKLVPKLMGPIDELKDMDLINFRRLSQDPNISSKKIIEKIGFLEEDGFAQKLAGIKAWRHSPVNKLYLEMGQESINERKSIRSIIEERKHENKKYLSEIEFSAIMDLNKSIRY
jgi:hypothetical protein